MFTIVYVSTAVRLFSADELSEVLPSYRENNLRLGVTGLLLYKQGSFMQALEGDEAAVRTLYASICKDQRHHHVVPLVAVPLAKRQFADWSMGFENLDGVDASSVTGYDPHPKFPAVSEELPWKASIAMSLLATFQHEDSTAL